MSGRDYVLIDSFDLDITADELPSFARGCVWRVVAPADSIVTDKLRF